MEAKMLVPRMFTDAAGDSRFHYYQVPLELHDHAPPAAPFFTTVVLSTAPVEGHHHSGGLRANPPVRMADA
jgi:hypothetical protein